MKIINCSLALLLSFFVESIQAQILPLAENGKVTFTEIVKLDSTYSATLLMNNANRWVKLLRNEDKKPMSIKSDSNSIKGSNNYLVYVETFKIGVLKKTSGHISYDFLIEIKQGRYKYTFTNFVFHYYDTNRLNSYDYLTPKPNGKTKKLEEKNAGGWIGTWRAHKVTTRDKMEEYTTNLKKMMAEDPDRDRLLMQKKEVEQKKLKDNW